MRFFVHSNYFVRFMVYEVSEMANKKVTKEEFLKRSKAKHGDKYDTPWLIILTQRQKLRLYAAPMAILSKPLKPTTEVGVGYAQTINCLA